jgi:tRNA(Ile)-lysidine synthase
VVREDVPALAKERAMGLEETAREVRYDVFDRLARGQSYDRVALGHHADDQVETILFRLIRGTGPSGLTGMPIKRGRIIRPLLDLTRVEIMDYLRTNSLSWCEDASNRSIRFKRNWIRHRLLPEIRKHLNPRADSAILALAETLGVEDEYLEAAPVVR